MRTGRPRINARPIRLGGRALALFMVIGLLIPVQAAVIYYVDQSIGSDATGNGSLANPWATIGKAVLSGSPVTGGDTIQVASGTYQETISGTFRGGSAGNPITLKANGSVTLTPATAAGNIFYPTGNSVSENHWLIDGFNLAAHSTPGSGTVIWGRYDGARNWAFQNNTFNALGQVWNGATDNHGISFENNTFQGVSTIIGAAMGTGLNFSHNVVLNSGPISIFAGQELARVSYNTIYGSSMGIYIVGGSVADPTHDILVANNTIYSTGGGEGIRLRYGTTLTDFLAVNNLIVGSGIAHRNMEAYFGQASYEFLYNNTTAYLGNWNTGNDVVGQDPMFISTTPGTSGFLRFYPDSPAASGADSTYAPFFGANAPVIPEPGTLVLLLMGGTLVWWTRSRMLRA